MLGAPIAIGPLAMDGLGKLTSMLGRTRLAELPQVVWRWPDAPPPEKDGAVGATRALAAGAMRP